MRQPHSRNCASVVRAAVTDSTTVDRTRPIGAPALTMLAHMPRRDRECSAAMRVAPPHSPPTATPCTSRSTTRRTGAERPIRS